jgi:pyridoxal phosphate enzyme (YggS family)
VNESQLRRLLQDRLTLIDERLRQAAARSGRRREDVTLVAVTKTVTSEVAAILPELGVLDLGESRPQELWRKAAAIPSARWHMIGHLQRNKIERTLPLVKLIHSVDSLHRLQAIEEEAAKRGLQPAVLLEVNVSGETTKQGLAPEELPGLMPYVAGLKQVRVAGLMTMAPLAEDLEQTRPVFAGLRKLRDQFRDAVAGQAITELSMGMSNDYEIAVEEGATLVRIGTALFEGIV